MKKSATIEIIKSKFEGLNSSAQIPLMKKGKSFTAILRTEGIEVDNLRAQKLIEWKAFEQAMSLLIKAGPEKGVAKGNAMNGKLGDTKLPTDSIEGGIAETVYKKAIGSTVFRRISPISTILSWAGLCSNNRGFLTLK